MSMNVGLVLATYKEELNIKELLNSIFNNLNVSKIVIVDDSPENLIQGIISNFKNIIYIHRGKKLGRGSAVIAGIKEILYNSEVNIIIEIDTDLSHDPSEIPENLKKFKRENLDLLISSRYLKESRILNWSLNRRLFSHLANFLTRLFLGVPVFNAKKIDGLFFNQFLPTSVGGDAIRVYNLYKQGYSGEGLAASTMMDRLIGLIALLILASLAVIFSGENVVPEAVAAMVTIVLAAFASGTLLFFIFPFPDSLVARAEKIDPHTFLGRLFRVLRVCRAYKGSSLLLLSSLFLSFILQGLMILVYVILARALDLDISLTMLLIAVPLVFVATALPLTIGGLGVREGVLVFMLGLFGIGIVPSGQLASVYLIVLWLSVIPGGWPFIFKRSIKNHGQ